MRFLALAVFLTFAISAAFGYQEAPKAQASTAPAVTPEAQKAPAKETVKEAAKPESVKPPKDFLPLLQQYLLLQKLIEETEKESGLAAMREKYNAIAERLRAQIPEGYVFDPQKQEFVLAPKQPEQKKPEEKK